MADVNQSLGFDASGAIKSLESLSFTIDTLNGSIKELAAVAAKDPVSGLRADVDKANDTIKRLEKQVSTLKSQLKDVGQEGSKAGKDLTVSWQTFFRVFQTQVVLRGLNELQRQFVETAEAARAFELQVARISTIAGEGFGSGSNELSASIRALAVDIGQPLEEVSGAAFQTLQNDIADTTQESLEFLRVANQLSVVLGSDLTDSLNSLTSIQKAYGQGVESAADNADILFVTIDKGRLTLDELADRLGTINPLANELNLSFDQVGASIAALSQSGLNTATATTQLRNVLTKLIRPTKDLQVAFEALGVSSGAELIASVGGRLPDALRKLQTVLGGTEAQVANAFGTIRGQLGVLNLLANDAKVATDIFGFFEQRAGRAAEAFAAIEETDTRAFDKQLAKLNDTLLDLGKVSSSVQLSLLSTFNQLIPDAQTAIGVLSGLGVAGAIAFNGIAVSAGRAALAIASAAGPVGILSVALGALVGEAIASLPDYEKQFRDTVASLDKSITQNNEEFAKAQQQSTKQLQSDLSARSSLYETFYNDLNQLYAEDTKAFQERSNLVGITVERLLESFTSSRENLLKRVDDFLNGIDERIADGTDRVSDALQDLDDFRFENAQKGLTEAQQAFNGLARAQQTALKAQQAFANAGVNEEQISAARDLQKLAETQARDAARLADRSDNGAVAQKAAQVQQQLLRQRVQQEQQTIKNLESLNNSSADLQRDKLASLLEQQKRVAEQIGQIRSDIDSEGQPKTGQQRLEDTQSLQPLLKQASDLQAQISQLRILDDAGARELSDKTAAAFSRGIDLANFNFDKAVLTLQQRLSQEKFGINIEIANPQSTSQTIRDLISGNQVSGESIGNTIRANEQDLTAFLRAQKEAANSADLAKRNINEQAAAITRLSDTLVRAAGINDDFAAAIGIGAVVEGAFGGSALKSQLEQAKQLVDLTNSLTAQFNRVIESNNQEVRSSVDTEIANIQAKVASISFLTEDQRAQLGVQAELIRSSLEQFSNLEQNRSVLDTDAQGEANRLLTLGAQAAAGFSEQLRLSRANAQGTQDITANINSQITSTNTPLSTAADLWASIAASAAAAASSTASVVPQFGQTQSNYFGGIVRRNFGGDLTRGQDQQLVAASAGEFITNARSSSRFFAELRAINAGQTPVFREQGGPVTNIGDVNVNVDARNAANVDGRNIARQLNRELRRTSSNLRG